MRGPTVGSITLPLPWKLWRRERAAIADEKRAARVVALRPTGRRTGYYVGLFTVVVLLSMLGLVMVLSASAASALREEGSSWYFFKRHAIWLVIGVGALLVTMRIDYRVWQRFTRPLLLLALTLLTVVLIPGVGFIFN